MLSRVSAGSRTFMDLRHTVHGKHRRRLSRRRMILFGAALAFVVVASVAAVVWPRGSASSEGRERAATSSGSHDGHVEPSLATAPAAPAASAATPSGGQSIPVGTAPHYMAIAPDGRFAYIADPGAGAVIRFDTTAGSVTKTIPIPEAPP